MSTKSYILFLIITLVLFGAGVFSVFDNRIYDTFTNYNQQDKLSQDIVIVEIDKKSIKEIGYWPWKRSIYAEGLKKIISSNPAVIGINLAFTYTQGDQKEDKQLYEVLKSFNNIVLVVEYDYYSDGKMSLLVPIFGQFKNIRKSHSIFTEKDIVRTFPSFKVLPAFSLVLLEMYSNKNKEILEALPADIRDLIHNTEKKDYTFSEMVSIDYQRIPANFKHISFVDLLNGHVSSDVLKNKIVLIGITDRFLTRTYSTPYVTRKENYTSSSVDLNAQIIDGLLFSKGLRKNNLILNALFIVVVSLLFYYLSRNQRFVFQGVMFIIAMLIAVLVSYLAFTHTVLWLPPSGLLFLILVIFGFHIYFTVTRLDDSLFKSLTSLQTDESIILGDIPKNINDKVQILNSLIRIIASDRQTIKAIMNGVNSGIVVIDRNTEILWTNKLFLNMFTNDLVLNSKIQDLIPEMPVDEILQLDTDNQILKKEISIDRQEFICHITPIYNEKQYYVAIFNDVTELKELDRLKTDLMRMVGHELKTPITNIMLAAEETVDLFDKDRAIKNSNNILDYAELMQNIITNFLNLNKLEHKMIDLIPEKTDLVSLASRCIDLHSPIAQTKNVQIVLENNNSDIVKADKKLLEIALNNLVSNAVKYSKENTQAIIRLDGQPESVMVSIIDHGVGIAEDELEKIFSKFYRAKNNNKHNIRGTGLGLSIVQKIIDLHNSTIAVTSVVDQGTTFTFELEKVLEPLEES